MKPSRIFDLMNMAVKAREKGLNFTPCFVGPAGVGKSEVVKSWVKEVQKTDPDFKIFDRRCAYLESPDFVGYPNPITTESGDKVTEFFVPSLWPREGRGLLLLEEVNRANTSVMNCLMQLLTDRKINDYTLPEGWIIASCINPENSSYDVNTMDAALKDRFEIFQVDYDHKDFVTYMREANWAASVINFVDSANWKFVAPENIADGAKYISPRTWSKINAAEQVGYVDDSLRLDLYTSILGHNVGKHFYQFACADAPVTFEEIVSKATRKGAIKRLSKHCDTKKYQADKVSITVTDIVDAVCTRKQPLDREILAEILDTLSADQGVVLIRELSYGTQDKTLTESLFKDFPSLKKKFADTFEELVKAK